MLLQFKQNNFISKLSIAIFASILLISCGGESSSNSDRNEVIDESINIDSTEDLNEAIENNQENAVETFNITDGDGNTVSCDSSEVTFDEDNFPSCPDSE